MKWSRAKPNAPARTEWDGYYFDGQTSQRHRAGIRLDRTGLHIATSNHLMLWWAYCDIRQTQGFYPGEQVRLERGGTSRETLLIPDLGILTALHHIAPRAASHFYNPALRRRRIDFTILAAMATVAITVCLYFWGIPVVSALVASYVPVSWEEQLGRSIAERLAPRGKHCTNATLSQAIHSITKTLTAPLSPTGYSFQVIVVDDPLVNAFAAPGGYIVVFRGLLERTRTPEQLAGVLAHEIQHIVHQHATRALLQNASTDLLLAAMTGSVSTAHGLEGTRTLGLLRYSRQHENEADTEALKLLISAKVDPVGLTGFFVELGAEDRKSSGLRTYLSTHPSSEDRVTNLLSLERQWIYQPVKLLKDADWGKIRNLC